MHKTIQLIFLCILGWGLPGLSAQGSYLPTVVEGNHWTIRQHQGMGSYADYGYALKCDTLIDNKIYLEVRSDDESLLGWTREDTTTQEVFYWKKGDPAEDRILSYQVDVKDTFWLKGFPLICDSINTRFSFGENRKVIYFTGFVAFIEGVGHSFYGIHDFGNYQNIESFTPDSVFCNPTTALDPSFGSAEWKVFPNPTSGILELHFPGQISGIIQLTDLLGRVFYQTNTPLQSPIQVDVSTWPNGIYLLMVNGQFVHKVIRQE